MKPAAALLAAAMAVLAAQPVPAAAQAAAAPALAPMPTLSPASCPRPVYPREAIRYELEGITLLRFRLAPDGQVSAVRVAQSSGWAMLDEAVAATVRACRFTPAQAARARGAELPVQFVWNLDGGHVIRPQLLPGSCPASRRFAGFQPYDDTPSGAGGIKVRLLVDPTGVPRGVKPEGASLAPPDAEALAQYVAGCRFGFDAALKGERTDTAYGRVLLR